MTANRLAINVILLMAACLIAGTTIASGEIVFVEDFQNYATGPIVSQSGLWNGSHVAVIEQELGNAANGILNHRMAAGQRDVYRSLAGAASVGPTATKTLFFRFRCENQWVDTGIGLTDVAQPAAWDDFRVQIQINNGQLGIRHGSQTLFTQSLQTGAHAGIAWYNLWIVVDNNTNTYKVYLLQSNDPAVSATETDRVTSGTIDTFNFRTSTGNTLNRFYMRANSNNRLWIDEIYVMDGHRLDNPITLQAAKQFHDLIAAAQDGDIVELDADTYTIGETIFIDKAITLVGRGRDETIIQAESVFQGNSLINISNTDDFRLTGVTLDAMSVPDINFAIALADGSGFIIESCRVKNIDAGGFSAGIYASQNVTDSLIAGNEVLNIDENSEWGTGIRIMNGSRSNLIDGNFISNVGRGGILTTNGSGDTRIVNNIVKNIGLQNPNPHDARTRLGIEVWNQTFDVAATNGNVIIEDNVVDHWISVDKHVDVAVRRNTVTGSELDSGVGYAGIESVGSKRIVITDNVVDGGSHVGLSTSNDLEDDLVFAARNTFRNAVRFNAQLQGTNTGPGMASRWYLHQNSFEDAGEHGIRLLGPLYGIVLDGNEFRNNGSFNAAIAVVQSPQMDQFVIVNNVLAGHWRSVTGSFSGNDLYWANNIESNTLNNGFTSSGFPDGQPTVPVIIVSGIEQVDSTLQFSIDGADPASDVLWDMGQGAPLVGQNVEYAFTDAGEYIVSAVVWNESKWGVLAQTTINISEPLRADFNADGKVNFLDYAMLSRQWMTDGGFEPSADLNEDGWVGVEDLAVMIQEWLKTQL